MVRTLLRSGIFWLLATGAALAAGGDPLPVEYFSRIPAIGGPYGDDDVKLSPDGEHYAAMVAVNGEPALVSVPTNGSKNVKVVRYDQFRPKWFGWATNRHLLISFDFGAGRSKAQWIETRLGILDIETGKVESILDYKKSYSRYQDGLISRLPVRTAEVLINLRGSVMRFPLTGNSRGTEVIGARAGINGWEEDSSGVVRLGYGLYRESNTGFMRPQARIVFRLSSDDDFETMATFDPRDVEGDAFDVIGFTEDPGVALITDLNEQGRVSLYRYDVVAGKTVGTVFSHPQYDFAGARYAPGSDRLLSVSYMADEPVTVYFDTAEEADQKTLDKLYPGMHSRVVSRDLDRTRAIVRTESPSSPPVFHYFDTARNVYLPLGSAYPVLTGRKLSSVRPITYRARDGLEIHGYLTLPEGASGKSMPLIVFPHGGPGARDAMTYDYWLQYFASRGWAVLQMNFRGSTGYGWDYEKAGHKQWGKAMQDDVTDGVAWALAEGIADPSRLCIVGGSYGGYVALEAAARTPELYRCAVSLNGVTDLGDRNDDLRRSIYFKLWEPYYVQDDPAALSPAHHADRIGVPVLVAYGTSDATVDHEQSEDMISALKRAGKPVVEVRLEGADHSLTREVHRVAFFTAMDAFLQEHLGLGHVPSPEAAVTEPR